MDRLRGGRRGRPTPRAGRERRGGWRWHGRSGGGGRLRQADRVHRPVAGLRVVSSGRAGFLALGLVARLADQETHRPSSSPCPAGHVGSGASGCCNDDGTVDCSGATEAAAATGCSVGDVEACLNGGVCAPNAAGAGNVCNCPVHFEARYRYFSTAVALSASLTWGVHARAAVAGRALRGRQVRQPGVGHARRPHRWPRPLLRRRMPRVRITPRCRRVSDSLSSS